MARKSLVLFQDGNSGILVADSANSPSTAVMRDSAGNTAVGQMAAAELLSGGILTLTTAAKAAAFTADGSATVYICDATTAAFAATLPPAASVAGRVYMFLKKDAAAHNVTVTPAGADTINGAATYALTTQYQLVRLISDGTTWWVI